MIWEAFQAMRRLTRIGILLCSIALIAGMMVFPASAEVMTLRVDLRGRLEQADGTAASVPVEGAFRVLQGGMEQGTLATGETMTLNGSGPVILEPLAETIDAGWDATGARTTVPMTSGNVTVPITLPRLTEKTVAQLPAETEAPAAENVIQTTTADGMNWEEDEDGNEETPEAPAPARAVTTPELLFTPVPTAAATPEPQVSLLSAGADKGAVRVKVFYDSNSNGDCSVYEKGIPDIPVYLVGADGNAVTGGRTGAEGEILLEGLTPGEYRIRVALPEEWGFNKKAKETGLSKSFMEASAQGTQDSEPVTVRAGEILERGVGTYESVTVSGNCWLDEDGNGVMADGERKVAGAHVTLKGQKNNLEYEAYSDENGDWRIPRVRPGFYDFTSYAPEGMMFTKYTKNGGKKRSVFTTEGKSKITKTLDTNDGHNKPDQNIGFTWTGLVEGMCFLDANYNGLYDEGEKPLAGVKVTAIKQASDEEIAIAYSGADGRYTITGLRANTYKIRAVLPEDGSDFTRAVSDEAGNHFVARDNRRENFLKNFALQNGEHRTVNVGAIYYGSVSGTVYLDDDFSASQNGGEKAVQGISVSLLGENGALVASDKTNKKGEYSFTRLTPGKYSLRMTAKEGYAFTKAGEGNVMLNLNGGEGYSEPFDVPIGTAVSGRDAGMIKPATVRGTVFADRNDNGLQDAGEGGLEGVTVRLMSEEGEQFSAAIGAEGGFLFDAVMPGRYYVEYTLPERAIFAKTVSGGNTMTGENGVGRGEWFELRTAGERTDPLVGALTLGRVQGTVFHDPDGSGLQDAGDAPTAGAKLILKPSREDLETAEAVSDDQGHFLIDHIHPDTYTLTLILPDGQVTSRLKGVTLPLVSGEAEQSAKLEVAMGAEWDGQMIGAVKPAVLRGRVWLDENNNGRREEDEQTPAGYTITVTDESDGQVFATLSTGSDGSFEAAGMVPGSFTVSYQMDEDTDTASEGDNTFSKAGSRMEMTGLSLKEGETREGLTLGLVRYTSLGGQVWIDRGEGAESLAGAAVILEDGEGRTVQTLTTGETGTWRFTGLMPGTYRIRTELPEGCVVAEPDDERLDTGLVSVVTETDGRRGATDPIDLRMGQDQLSLNIGSVLPGTIGDYCWLDENGNGWQDSSEPAIAHVKVELVRNGVTVAETETDGYGLYFFREVYPAVYTLKVTAPPEIRPTQKRTDIYLIVSSLNETDDTVSYTDEFAVQSDSTDFNIDLGFELRQKGVYPAGIGEGATMDWSRSYENKSTD